MALIKCKECKKEIAKDAKICPNCGTLTEHGKELKVKMQKSISITMVVLIVLLILIYAIVIAKNEKNRIIGKWVQENDRVYGKFIDVFIFNSDGTCINELISVKNNGNEDASNDPCTYNIKGNEITITWLDDDSYWYDENKNEVKSLTMPFFQGDNYIVIDEDKYEKSN